MRERFKQGLQQAYPSGIIADLGTCDVFVYAYWFGGDGVRVTLLSGDAEPLSCISLRQDHAQALAAALRRVSVPSGLPVELVSESVADQATTIQLRRVEGSLTLGAIADGSRISSSDGLALSIALEAAPRLAEVLADSLERLDDD